MPRINNIHISALDFKLGVVFHMEQQGLARNINRISFNLQEAKVIHDFIGEYLNNDKR